jgi:pimeloyl-ACP methyl ester carboxylesterase
MLRAPSMLRRALSAVTSQLASGVDQVFYSTALQGARHAKARARETSATVEERLVMLEGVRRLYEAGSQDDASFFPDPGLVEARVERVRGYESFGEVADVRWKSRFEPHAAEVRARYQAHEQNGVAHARLFSHRHERRPAIVLIHGYLGGTFPVEEAFWPLSWMNKQGLDVALMVLPFHGSRRRGLLDRPAFPSNDPRMTIESFRQAIFDLRALSGWLRARGAPAVGVMGMSLGGYTSALWATVDPTLSFAVPLIPLASLADFVRDGGRLSGSPEQQEQQYRAVEAAHRSVDPLVRPSKLAPGRVLVLAGEHDRITPITHAERMAAHFDAPIEMFPGGHLLQLGLGGALGPVGRLIERATGA